MKKKYSLFTTADPLTYLVKGKNNWNGFLSACIIFMILQAPIYFSVWLENLWHLPGIELGVLEDLGWFGSSIFFVLPLFVILLWLPDGIQSIIDGLKDNKVILGTIKGKHRFRSYNNFIQEFDRKYSSYWWLVISLVIIPYMLLVFAPQQQQYVNWPNKSNFLFGYMIFYWTLIYFILSIIVIKLIISIYWLNLLFMHFHIDVIVLHPDNSGGLAQLGDFGVKIGYILGLIGFISVLQAFNETLLFTGKWGGITLNPLLIINVAFYILISPVLFFAPIGSAHSAMKKAKTEFLLQISKQFEKEKYQVLETLNSDADSLRLSVEKIKQIQELHQIGMKFPVWPFNTSNIIRFSSSVVAPIILAILSDVLSSLII